MTEEYWRDKLGAVGKQAYDAMKAALMRGQTDVPLPRGMRDFKTCFEAVTFDHPEFYWVGSRCSVTQGFGGARLQFSRIYSPVETKKFDIKIEAANDAVKSRVQGISDERELCRIVADYLLDNVTYQIDIRMNQNAAAALCLYKAQCTGIALAAKTLLDVLGVWCIVVNGEMSSGGKGGPHCWNIVRIGGNYYHLDVTSMLGANGGAGGAPAHKPYNHLYLSYSDAKIAATHSWKKQTPPCTDTRYDEAEGFCSRATASSAQSVRQQPEQAAFSRQALPVGLKAVSSQYEIKQLLPARPSGTFKTTFCYLTDAIPQKQEKLVEEAIRSYFTARNIGGSFSYSYTGSVWTIELKFEV